MQIKTEVKIKLYIFNEIFELTKEDAEELLTQLNSVLNKASYSSPQFPPKDVPIPRQIDHQPNIPEYPGVRVWCESETNIN
jgi:hypothetical protein